MDPDIFTVKLYLPSPVIFCVIYIPPSSSDSSWSSLLNYLTHSFTSVDLPVVVSDFNCPHIYCPLLYSRLCDLVFDFNLYQCVDQPTHIKSNILDLIITNSIDRISGVTVHQEPFPSSDHLPISFSLLDINTYTSSQLQPHNFFNYAKADYHGMCDFLRDWDFNICFDSLDVEVMAISKCVPFVTTSRRHSHLPKWFDSNTCHNLHLIHLLTVTRFSLILNLYSRIKLPRPSPLMNLISFSTILKRNHLDCMPTLRLLLTIPSFLDKSSWAKPQQQLIKRKLIFLMNIFSRLIPIAHLIPLFPLPPLFPCCSLPL